MEKFPSFRHSMDAALQATNRNLSSVNHSSLSHSYPAPGLEGLNSNGEVIPVWNSHTDRGGATTDSASSTDYDQYEYVHNSETDYKIESLIMQFDAFKSTIRADFEAGFTNSDKKIRTVRKDLLSHVTDATEEAEDRITRHVQSRLDESELSELEFRKKSKDAINRLRSDLEGLIEMDTDKFSKVERRLRLMDMHYKDIKAIVEEVKDLKTNGGSPHTKELLILRDVIDAEGATMRNELSSMQKENEQRYSEVHNQTLELRKIVETVIESSEETCKARDDHTIRLFEVLKKEYQNHIDERVSAVHALIKEVKRQMDTQNDRTDLLSAHITQLEENPRRELEDEISRLEKRINANLNPSMQVVKEMRVQLEILKQREAERQQREEAKESFIQRQIMNKVDAMRRDMERKWEEKWQESQVELHMLKRKVDGSSLDDNDIRRMVTESEDKILRKIEENEEREMKRRQQREDQEELERQKKRDQREEERKRDIDHRNKVWKEFQHQLAKENQIRDQQLAEERASRERYEREQREDAGRREQKLLIKEKERDDKMMEELQRIQRIITQQMRDVNRLKKSGISSGLFLGDEHDESSKLAIASSVDIELLKDKLTSNIQEMNLEIQNQEMRFLKSLQRFESKSRESMSEMQQTLASESRNNRDLVVKELERVTNHVENLEEKQRNADLKLGLLPDMQDPSSQVSSAELTTVESKLRRESQQQLRSLSNDLGSFMLTTNAQLKDMGQQLQDLTLVTAHTAAADGTNTNGNSGSFNDNLVAGQYRLEVSDLKRELATKQDSSIADQWHNRMQDQIDQLQAALVDYKAGVDAGVGMNDNNSFQQVQQQANNALNIAEQASQDAKQAISMAEQANHTAQHHENDIKLLKESSQTHVANATAERQRLGDQITEALRAVNDIANITSEHSTSQVGKAKRPSSLTDDDVDLSHYLPRRQVADGKQKPSTISGNDDGAMRDVLKSIDALNRGGTSSSQGLYGSETSPDNCVTFKAHAWRENHCAVCGKKEEEHQLQSSDISSRDDTTSQGLPRFGSPMTERSMLKHSSGTSSVSAINSTGQKLIDSKTGLDDDTTSDQHISSRNDDTFMTIDVACTNLIRLGGRCDPMVVLFRFDPKEAKLIQVNQTEYKTDTENPVFHEKLFFTFNSQASPESLQSTYLRFCVYGVKSPEVDEEDQIGATDLTLADLLQYQDVNLQIQLTHSDDPAKTRMLEAANSQIHIASHASPMKDRLVPVQISVECRRLPTTGKPDKVVCCFSDNRQTFVGRTEAVSGTTDPIFTQALNVHYNPMRPETKLGFRVYDFNDDGHLLEENVIGEVEVYLGYIMKHAKLEPDKPNLVAYQLQYPDNPQMDEIMRKLNSVLVMQCSFDEKALKQIEEKLGRPAIPDSLGKIPEPDSGPDDNIEELSRLVEEADVDLGKFLDIERPMNLGGDSLDLDSL